MPCLCSQQITALGKNLAMMAPKLQVHPGLIPPTLRIAAAINLDLLPTIPPPIINVNLPKVPIGPAGLAKIHGAGMTMAYMKTAFGINLAGPNVALPLLELGKSVHQNAPLLTHLPTPAMQPMLGLMAVLAPILAIKATLNLDMFSINAPMMLGQKLAPLAQVYETIGEPSANLTNLMQLAMVIQAAQMQFGVNLGTPQGPTALMAAMLPMTQLQIPQIALNLPKLNLVLLAVKVEAMLNDLLGLSLLDPASPKKLADALNIFTDMKLPSIKLPRPLFNLSALQLALQLPPMALNVDMTPLSTALGSMPQFPGLNMIASLVMSVKAAFGLNLVANVGCGAGGCPMG